MDRRGACFNDKVTKKILQEDYDNAYLGPEFFLEFRYSQLLSNIYMTMMFSCGMPLLYPVAVFSFFLIYWIDKWMCKFVLSESRSLQGLPDASTVRYVAHCGRAQIGQVFPHRALLHRLHHVLQQRHSAVVKFLRQRIGVLQDQRNYVSLLRLLGSLFQRSSMVPDARYSLRCLLRAPSRRFRAQSLLPERLNVSLQSRLQLPLFMRLQALARD